MTLELTKEEAEILSNALGIASKVFSTKSVDAIKAGKNSEYLKATENKTTCWLLKLRIDEMFGAKKNDYKRNYR